ncbi:Variable surface protein Vir7-like protein [Plasmodium coatneyi]|uniref:Variable surface protein Vir7-like protein n=1 Tax=Plasmodium coatneyi TaxID=208452 RepID=A0A1B1DWL4_9APIC|nr:Variable surface protein Vir7-like protein [Plasmodium coatneyi]ANQ07140.1 Variable surface protein Vir7-like protein [Plasmodium coatneyi]
MVQETTGTLTKEDLAKLPSYKEFYSKFNDGCGGCDRESWVQGLKENFDGQHTSISKHTDKIKNTWCCVSKMDKSGQPLYGQRCNFLYYWIGDFLFRNVEDATMVPVTLSLICRNIKTTYLSERHGLICETTEKELFNNRKLIFDYWQDYKTIQSLMKSSDSNCNATYGSYLQSIVAAYNSVNANCTDPANSKGPYCTKFQEMFNGGGIPKPSELICAEEHSEKSSTQHHSGHPELGAAPIVSSALATTIGIGTAIVFYLYKVIVMNIIFKI